MKKLLKKHFGHDTFRPFQEEIITHVLKKKDTFVLMPTGGGKSLCYQLPALKLAGLTLVISPLISLMKDQVDALKMSGIAAEFINSSLPQSDISRIQKDIQKGKIRILYIAPERLALHSFKGYLDTLDVSLIAIDEAHCISEWGHDFRPDYRNLKFFKEQYPDTPMIALTATATPVVQNDIIKELSLHSPKRCVASFNRENLTFRILRKKHAFDKLLGLLEKHKNESVIVYCFSRRETEEIADNLNAEGYKALPYHAGLDSTIRKSNQEQFITDEAQIMVATIAFGMGIDKPDVRMVVHYTFPKNLEGYYQEVGRAGRDGLPSECVLLYSYGDKRKHDFFLDKIQDVKERENKSKQLDNVIAYSENRSCRRKYILEYFGETYPPESSISKGKKGNESCGACDSCLRPRETFDATIITQKILSCVLRTGSRFGKNYIVAVLKGSRDEQVLRNRHDSLSVYGIVNDHSKDELKEIITSLLQESVLISDKGKYPTLSVAPKGITFLKQKETLHLPKIHEDLIDAKNTGKRETLEYNTGLFEKLRTVRKQLADKRGVPPFVIFSDVTLQALAYYLPQNKENFIKIEGVGEQKLKEFGELFIATITTYAKKNTVPSHDIPDKNRRKTSSAKRKIHANALKYHQTKEMVSRKMPLKKIAKEHGVKESTIINHLDRLLDAEEKLDLGYLTPSKESIKTIAHAFEHCGEEMLRPVFEYLGEQYSYEEIKLVRVILKANME
ncbi:DNA helicase RecQ [Patescibacteria group bacterium]|nr:DNA helicase RecQ [Patescibacteria group bacterium]